MKPQESLTSQQTYLATQDEDIRISHLARFIHSLLTVPSGRLLDIGAGNGIMLKYFKSKGFHVAGIEYDSELVQRMKHDVELQNISINQGDITKLHGDQSYDIVIASDVIEHIADDMTALQQMWTYLKPQGLLVITVPAHQYLYCQRDRDWGHFRRYDSAHLHKMLIDLHGTIVHETYWNLIGYLIYVLFEHVLHSKKHESVRYGNSIGARVMKFAISKWLRLEELGGGVFYGLTRVVVVQKVTA